VKRRDLLRAVVAVPVVALLPVVGAEYVSSVTLGTIEPNTTYTYHTTVMLPPIRFVPIGPGVGNGMIFPPSTKDFEVKRLVWRNGLS